MTKPIRARACALTVLAIEPRTTGKAKVLVNILPASFTFSSIRRARSLMTLISQDFLKETGRLREPAPENGTSRAAPGRSALPATSVGLGLVVGDLNEPFMASPTLTAEYKSDI